MRAARRLLSAALEASWEALREREAGATASSVTDAAQAALIVRRVKWCASQLQRLEHSVLSTATDSLA